MPGDRKREGEPGSSERSMTGYNTSGQWELSDSHGGRRLDNSSLPAHMQRLEPYSPENYDNDSPPVARNN